MEDRISLQRGTLAAAAAKSRKKIATNVKATAIEGSVALLLVRMRGVARADVDESSPSGMYSDSRCLIGTDFLGPVASKTLTC
eukprot:s2176_g4.t1